MTHRGDTGRMVEPVPGYSYPVVSRPISEAQLLRELGGMLSRAGLDGDGGPAATAWFWDPLDAEHEENPRRYAQVIPSERRFEFARAVLWLRPEHREGLLAHEVGHVLDPEADEDGADAAARRVIGVDIGYDNRWPGKGLQIARRQANPPPKGYSFWRACTDFQEPRGGHLVQYIKEHGKPISYTTFARHADLAPLRAAGHPAMYRISRPDNWAIAFYRSRLPSGMPVYFFDWSRIEHVFVPSEVDLEREYGLLD